MCRTSALLLQLRRSGQSQTLSDTTIRDYLLHKWQTPDNIQWPTEKRTTMGRTINYRLSRDTFRRFDWVVYSSSEDSLFCKVCAMFEPFDSADRRGLVNIPFNRYSKLYGAAGKLTTHGSQHVRIRSRIRIQLTILMRIRIRIQIRGGGG
jgi:hypothetical protein